MTEHPMLDIQRTCVLRKRRWGRWSDHVICGWAIAEQYLRQGYVFDWAATDCSRTRQRAHLTQGKE